MDVVRIYDPAQVRAIQHMLQVISADSDALYPVAFISDGKFKSLDLNTDSTEALENLVNHNDGDNTIAVSRDAIMGIDSTTKEMAGIICMYHSILA